MITEPLSPDELRELAARDCASVYRLLDVYTAALERVRALEGERDRLRRQVEGNQRDQEGAQ